MKQAGPAQNGCALPLHEPRAAKLVLTKPFMK